jgi:hypothetical protein
MLEDRIDIGEINRHRFLSSLKGFESTWKVPQILQNT